MSENNKIIDTLYNEVEKPEFYTISEASKKIDISTTKINHWIFKLNKAKENFFNNSSKLTEDDLDKIKLAQSLLDDGYNFAEIINHFTDEANALINKDDSTIKKTNLTKLDSQVLSKALTIEVEKNINKLINSIQNEFSENIIGEFKQEASKIAGSSLKAIEQTKNEMLNEVVALKKQNDMFKSELERMYSKQTDELRRKLEAKEEAIKKLEEEKNKGFFAKFFKK